MTNPRARPFTVAVPDDVLEDLHARLERTRWPEPAPYDGWGVGTDAGLLRRLAGRWRDGYDWRAQEAAINALPHFLADIDGTPVHFLHFLAENQDAGETSTGGGEAAPSARDDLPHRAAPRSERGAPRLDRAGPLPLLLTHGWPGSFLELAALAQRLAAPSAFGLGARQAFDVVVPSLPGFGFSPQRPEVTDVWSTPALWHALMTDVLGYERYGAHGGDLGAGVSTRLAARHPEAVVGLHLTAVAAPADRSDPPLTDAEERMLTAQSRWGAEEGAYLHQQQTKPLTLAYGLADSPVGWLAWIVEKLRSWSDCGGDVSTRFTDDELLTWASLYWLTNTIASSFRPYNDHHARGTPTPRVSVPTAVAVFPHDLSQPPREWAERTYDVVRYTRFERGGHFPGHEEPDLLAADLAAFFAPLS